jgi:hypothetical protein
MNLRETKVQIVTVGDVENYFCLQHCLLLILIEEFSVGILQGLLDAAFNDTHDFLQLDNFMFAENIIV